MPRSGYIKRTNPRVTVLRGYDPNEPTTFTQTHPVASGVTIESGMIVFLEWDGSSQYEWVIAPALDIDNADGRGVVAVPYVALQDWDAAAGAGQGYDPDVTEAGKLTGLSTAGQFEIQTAHYDSGTYTLGEEVAAKGSLGNIKVAAANDFILGQVSRTLGQSSPISLDGVNSGVVNKNVITYVTNWSGRQHA